PIGSSRKVGAGAMAAGLPDSCGRSDWRTAEKSIRRDSPEMSLESAAERMPKKATPGAAKKLTAATMTASSTRLPNSFFNEVSTGSPHQRTNVPDAQTKAPPERVRRGWCDQAATASGGHGPGQVLGHLVEEALGGQPALLVADQQGEVLGHEAGFHRLDDDPLEGGGEGGQVRVVVQLGAVGEAAGPGEDRGD